MKNKAKFVDVDIEVMLTLRVREAGTVKTRNKFVAYHDTPTSGTIINNGYGQAWEDFMKFPEALGRNEITNNYGSGWAPGSGCSVELFTGDGRGNTYGSGYGHDSVPWLYCGYGFGSGDGEGDFMCGFGDGSGDPVENI